MSVPIFIIEILWLTIWIVTCIDNMDALASVNCGSRLAAMIIFLIGAPFFLIANALEGLLSLIFPDDWNDNDPFFKGW